MYVGGTERAERRRVVDRGRRHFGFGLPRVIRLEPDQAAVQALLTAHLEHGGIAERQTLAEVEGAATVEATIVDVRDGTEGVAGVEAIVGNQEAVHRHQLTAEGKIHAVLAQRRDQLARAPTQVGVFHGSSALIASRVFAGVAIAHVAELSRLKPP